MKMQGGMFVKSLFSYADAYIKNCTWKDLALVKFCLCAIGVMIGLSVPKEKRKIPFLGSLLVFLVTYFPLMGKFIRVIKVERKKQTAYIQPVKRQGKKEKNKQQECGKYRVPAVFV